MENRYLTHPYMSRLRPENYTLPGEPVQDYPGIYIDLERGGKRAGAPLLLLDFSHTEFPECKNPEMAEKGVLACRCWQDVRQEGYKEKDRTVFTGYDEFFAAQPDEPEEAE